jgi:cytidylate kinase
VGPPRIITIDGPAGAGKSTVGRLLAQSLGYLYLDSGAFYRAVAWAAARRGLDLTEARGLEDFLAGFAPDVASDARGFHLWLEGVEVTQELRAPQVSQDASRVATIPAVRRWVKERLRLLARAGGVVAEGRDQGTAVFPDAEFKFYLDAALEIRARRRRQDWQRDGDPPPLKEIIAQLAARDRQDESRGEAPLMVPPDAIRLDTTNLSIDEVIQQCLARIRAFDPGRGDHKPSKTV